MNKKFKIFLSSNQIEFEKERIVIKNIITKDPIYNSLFDIFLFEGVHASGKSPEKVYLEEVNDSEIYIGLIGDQYGTVQENGFSATENEFNEFVKGLYSKNVYIYINQTENADKNSKNFLRKIKNKYKYSNFQNIEILKTEIKKSLHNFVFEKNIISNKDFDERIVMNSNYKNVDEEIVKNFLKKTDISHNLGDISENIKNTLLNRLNVLINVEDELKLTNTGILFFSKNPEKFIPQHEIRMIRFKTNIPTEIIDKLYVKSNICDILRNAELFFNRNTQVASKITGFKRQDIPEYPYVAIREAIVNAIAHRDYNIKGSVITFFIFPNRIEVTSPGTLVPPLTLDELGDKPVHRNINICRLLEKTMYMEEAGSGIPRMRKEMREYNLEEPIFSQENDFFKVTFHGLIMNMIIL
ncbi:ATP-binding protein [Methanobrevibacter sp. DSM 116169]|uniref:ATP-binding protein n=1 Tax=Methanobrevibacter sp. DSM 116169 TaxID=3242727 RepID=UPI0038FD0027